jgi:hypothetical protein
MLKVELREREEPIQQKRLGRVLTAQMSQLRLAG